jgi:hypothetical protein
MEYPWDLYSVRITILARQLSVRKVVPTLTSMSAEIYLSMAGAKQLDDMRFILIPVEAVRPAGCA